MAANRCGAQQGSMLIELMIVAAVALALAVWGSHEWAERVRVLQARSLAVWMESARDAMQAYLVREGAPQDAPPESPADLVRVPTWDDLQAQGLLPAGWQPVGPLGQSLGIAVWRDGDCTQGACRLRALVHTRSALRLRQGGVDDGLIAEWLMAAQGRGLVLWPHRPDAFSGAGQQVPVPDVSAEPWVPGMVALMASQEVLSGLAGGPTDSGETEDFLRVRDSRDPDFQNDVSVQGNIRSGRELVARESVVLEESWKAGTACPTEGALGRDQSYPGVLLCRQGKWQLVARASGGGYLLNSRRGCKNSLGSSTANPYTGDCFCPTGFGILQISESGSAVSAEGLSMGYLCVPN